jgi:preprotein translocase subunit SecG
MLDILLVVHIVISVLLIVVILLQKNNSDGLAGLGGSGSNMGLVTARAAANFFTRVTVFLAVLFMANSLLLANLSNRNHKKDTIEEKLEENSTQKHNQPLPMAK